MGKPDVRNFRLGGALETGLWRIYTDTKLETVDTDKDSLLKATAPVLYSTHRAAGTASNIPNFFRREMKRVKREREMKTHNDLY